MSIICFVGIFIGSFALAIVTAIMEGFEVAIHTKIQGVHAHLIVDAHGKPINIKALSSVFTNEFPEICSFSPHTERNALIRPINSNNSTPTVVIIKSIDPEKEKNTSCLFEKIVNPIFINNFTDFINKNMVMVGKQYATSNNVSVGDNLELLFPREEEIKGNTVTFDSEKAIIGAIFDTGVDEFDSNVIYCTFSFLKNIFPTAAVEQVNLKLHSTKNESVVAQKLRNRLGLSVYSWKDLYPSLVATLTLEKYVSFCIIALIILVASMNMMSLMFMHITQKRHDIAILKALGMTNSAICSVFFITGLILSISASILGLTSALFTTLCIQRYPCISLPDTYYTTYLPIIMEPHTVISIFCLVLFCTFCALYFSTKQIYSINASSVLRFEH